MFVMLGKGAAALREMAIAYHYGISPVVDAYQLTFSMITFLPAAFVVGLQIMLVPTLVRLRSQPMGEQARFLGELQMVALVFGTGCAAVLFVAWPWMLGLFARNLSGETREMSRAMMMAMCPVGILMMTICVFAARLQARERHINTLLEALPAVVVLLFLVAAQQGNSPAPLMWGTTIGFLLQAVWLGALARVTDGVRTRFFFSLRSPQWSRNYRTVGMFFLGQLVLSLAVPLDQYFVAGLGDGAIATLSYSGRLIALLEGVGAIAIGRATLPVFSDIQSSGEPARAREMALKWSFLMLGCGVLVVAIVWPLAPIVIKLMFQHGAFTDADTSTVAHLLRWSLAKLPFYFAQLVLLQLFASEGRLKELAGMAIVCFIVKAIANVVLIRWFGIVGIVLASAAFAASALVFYLLILSWDRHVRTATRSRT
ncbi:conserved membrane protein of unknown function [Burkholderia multivorans]